MKKLIFISLIIFFGMPLIAYSAEIGGPPTKGFNLGFSTEYTNFRGLKSNPTSSPEPSINGNPGCNIRHMYRTMLKVGYGFFDFLEAYIKIGGGSYKFRTDIEDAFTGFPVGNAELRAKYSGFAWGVGVKGAYEFKDGPVRGLLVGADVQYIWQRNHHKTMTEEIGDPGDDFTGKATLQEWQIGPFVGYRIKKLLPYVGVKYSDIRLKVKGDEDSIKFKADNHFGVYVGLTYDIIPQLGLNIEGRFIDETGVNFNVIYRFK